MEVERRHAFQHTDFVQVLVDGQGRDLILGPLDGCRTQPKLIHYGHSEPIHQRASVLAEALLAWNEFMAVVGPRSADGRLAGADLFRCRAGLLLP